MADRWAVANGNWSSTATWNGGTLPTAADDVFADGFTVTIDQNVTVLSVRNTQRTGGTAGGNFTLSAGFALTANVIAGTTTCVTFNATSPNSATIIGNCTGGSAGNAVGVVNNSTGTLNITGNCTGGISGTNNSNACGAANNSTGIINITGNCIGGGGGGVNVEGAVNNSTGTINITGNCIGGLQNSSGVRNVTAGSVTITGNCTGGSNNNAFGANNSSTGTLTITGNCTGGSGGTNAEGVRNSSTGTLTITGNCTGGSSGTNPVGAWNNSTGTLTITGNCTGGSGGVNSHGAVWVAGGTGTVDGDIAGSLFGAGLVVQGSHTATAQVDLLPGHTITAGSYAPGGATGAFYPGLRTLLRSRVRVPSTIVNGTGGQQAIEGIFFRDSTLPYSTFPLTYIDVSNVVTTQTMYAAGQSPGGIVAGDLRAGVSLDGGALVGTLAVPAANQVAVGVAVDNTVGTAVLTESTLRAAIGLANANLDAQLITIQTIDNNVDAVESVVNSLDLRLPNALVSGRMDSSVGAMAANTLTASALATDAVTEIQAGLALQTTSLAIKAKTDLITAGNISVLQDRVNDNTITMQYNENTSATVNLDEDTTSATLQFVVQRPDGSDVLSIANASITRNATSFTVTITTAVTGIIGQYLWSLRDLTGGGNRVVTKGVLTVQNAASIDA